MLMEAAVELCFRCPLQVQHALKKSEAALETLNRAIGIDPKNPLCKFHRASILFASDKYKVTPDSSPRSPNTHTHTALILDI